MQWTTPEHGFSRDFQTAINIQDEIYTPRKHLVPLEPPFSVVESNIPIQVDIACGYTDTIQLRYHRDAFEDLQMQKLSEIFLAAINTISTPDTSMEACLSSLMSDSEHSTLSSLGNWKGKKTDDRNTNDTLITMFSKAVTRDPSAIAIQKDDSKMTYDELDSKSTILARRISPKLQKGDVVCVHADRSFEWIIAVYGVIKAGAIYCPLSEHLPPSVRTSIYITSEAKLFLVTPCYFKRDLPSFCGTTIDINDILKDDDMESAAAVSDLPEVEPGDGAYLCFTSGSTGKPKGVLCHHRGLVAFQENFDVRLHSRSQWKIAQMMSTAFDGSIHEIFSALSYGATLLLRSKNELSCLMNADAAILTPSIARALDIQAFPNLKVVYFVGEAVTQDLCNLWAAEKIVFNMYGPTEATCGATIVRLFPNVPVSLGSPNPSTRIYVLDRNRNLSPRGLVGEIYLAGVQVATGYIANKDETERRFFLDSICPNLGQRMYKTGDNAYWNEEGKLMLVGRSDRQVKLRGFRIDLDGLETQFLGIKDEAIRPKQVAIIVIDGDLVAYVQPEDLDVRRYESMLRKQVAHYAIPRWVLAVHEFPMTLAKKRDYKKLESIFLSSQINSSVLVHQRPDDLESTIIKVLRETLTIDEDIPIHPNSNFIDLGATSVSFLFLSHRLSKLLSRRVFLRTIIDCETPKELAVNLSSVDFNSSISDGVGKSLGETNISPVETDWWNKYRLHHITSCFNVSFACKLDEGIDVAKLTLAWNTVLSSHHILNCNYRSGSGPELIRTHKDGPPKALHEENIDIDQEINVSFDLRHDSLIRVLCSSNLMLVVASHIICDLTTVNKLLEQVADVYEDRSPIMSNLLYSESKWYRDLSESCRVFWPKYLHKARLPVNPPGFTQKRSSWRGSSEVLRIANTTYQKMKEYAAAQKATMHQLSLAAVALALQTDEHDLDIVIGAPYLNRNSSAELEMIGLFLQPLPIRIQYSLRSDQSSETTSYIQSVRQSSRDAVCHAIPFHQIMSLLGREPTYPDNDLLNVMVTFHEAEHMPKFKLGNAEPIHTYSEGAKFKLMVELSTSADFGMIMRLEYSTECFTPAQSQAIGHRILKAFDGMTRLNSFEELRGEVRDASMIVS